MSSVFSGTRSAVRNKEVSVRRGSTVKFTNYQLNFFLTLLKTLLITKLELFLGRPLFHSSVVLINSQLVCFRQLGFLSLLRLFEIFLSFS